MEPKIKEFFFVILFFIAAMNYTQVEGAVKINATTTADEDPDAILNQTTTGTGTAKIEVESPIREDEMKAMDDDMQAKINKTKTKGNKSGNPAKHYKIKTVRMKMQDWGANIYPNIIIQPLDYCDTAKCCCYYGPKDYYNYVTNRYNRKQPQSSCAPMSDYAVILFWILTAGAGLLTGICTWLILAKARSGAFWRKQFEMREDGYHYIPSSTPPPNALVYIEYEDETE